MKLEFIRSLNNKTYLYVLLSVILCFVLGYILLVSLDKLDYVSFNELIYSVYTVYTQLGFFIFTVITFNFFMLDYKQKNILFYKNIGFNEYSWYLSKLIILLSWITISNFVCLTFVSIIYKDFSNFFEIFLYYQNILIYIVLYCSALAFLFKDTMVAFTINGY